MFSKLDVHKVLGVFPGSDLLQNVLSPEERENDFLLNW